VIAARDQNFLVSDTYTAGDTLTNAGVRFSYARVAVDLPISSRASLTLPKTLPAIMIPSIDAPGIGGVASRSNVRTIGCSRQHNRKLVGPPLCFATGGDFGIFLGTCKQLGGRIPLGVELFMYTASPRAIGFCTNSWMTSAGRSGHQQAKIRHPVYYQMRFGNLTFRGHVEGKAVNGP